MHIRTGYIPFYFCLKWLICISKFSMFFEWINDNRCNQPSTSTAKIDHCWFPKRCRLLVFFHLISYIASLLIRRAGNRMCFFLTIRIHANCCFPNRFRLIDLIEGKQIGENVTHSTSCVTILICADNAYMHRVILCKCFVSAQKPIELQWSII